MRDRFILIGFAVAAIIIIGAGVFLFNRNSSTGTSSSAANNQPSAAVVPFTTITQGEQSAVAERVNYSITSSDQLSKLWKLIGATGTPPTVDFNTHMVLAVFAGKETSSAIAVAKIEDTNARLVSIAIAKPDSTCAQKQPAVSPYVIVAVPTTSLPLTHEDISTTANCPK